MNKQERERLREICKRGAPKEWNEFYKAMIPAIWKIQGKDLLQEVIPALLDHIDALEGQIEGHQRQKKNVHSIMEQNAIYDGRPSFINDGYLIHLLNYHGYGGTVSDYKDAKQEMENPRIYRTQICISYEDITEKELSRAAVKAALTQAEEKGNG